MPVYGIVLISIFLFALGGFLGFYITRKVMQKQIRDNPPIDEKMIRLMYTQMGRKPSEVQIKQIMNRLKSDPTKK